MHPVIVLQLLALLVLANGTPVVAKKILGNRLSYPLDGNVRFLDGRPLFGRSKTIRGVVLGVLAAMAGAPLIGLGPEVGVLVGSLATSWVIYPEPIAQGMAVDDPATIGRLLGDTGAATYLGLELRS